MVADKESYQEASEVRSEITKLRKIEADYVKLTSYPKSKRMNMI